LYHIKKYYLRNGRDFMAAKNTLTTGIAELLILSILNEKDSYGYEICKIIKENSDGLISLSYNTTYAATCKMIDSGLVTEKNVKVGKNISNPFSVLKGKR
jgi:DNA-binding PadR family transcriptional regulator